LDLDKINNAREVVSGFSGQHEENELTEEEKVQQ